MEQMIIFFEVQKIKTSIPPNNCYLSNTNEQFISTIFYVRQEHTAQRAELLYRIVG